MRYVAIVLMSVCVVAFAAAQLDEPVSDIIRLVEAFDNHADTSVSRVLAACDALQLKLDKGEKVKVRDAVVAAVLAVDDKAVEQTMQKVEAELKNAGIRLEYIAKDEKGDVVKAGSVGVVSALAEAPIEGEVKVP